MSDVEKVLAAEAAHYDRCASVEEILDKYAEGRLDSMPPGPYGALVKALARLIENAVDPIRAQVAEELGRLSAQDTYTDCEEYRREGAISALEDLLDGMDQ